MTVLRQLRTLLLGETRSLPAGVATGVLLAALVRELSGPNGWWETGGGFLVLALMLGALAASLRTTVRPRRDRTGAREARRH
jgi:hypothetical protein